MEKVHERGIIYRDIKPDNFCMGGSEENKHKVYIIDFGLAKKYLDKNGAHQAFTSGKKLCGTARYASIEMHKGS